jgi:hypothetical protein
LGINIGNKYHSDYDCEWEFLSIKSIIGVKFMMWIIRTLLVVDVAVHVGLLWLSLFHNTIPVSIFMGFTTSIIFVELGININVFLLNLFIAAVVGVISYSHYYEDGNTIITALLTVLVCLYVFLLVKSFYPIASCWKLSSSLLIRFGLIILSSILLGVAMTMFGFFWIENYSFDDLYYDGRKIILISLIVGFFIGNAITVLGCKQKL